jgi:uncharacterized protein
MRYVMIPGHGGSGAGHWQSAWEADLAGRAGRIAPPSWTEIDERGWSEAITRAVSGRTVLVAHSLGCLAAASWLAGHPGSDVCGAFLVAPPDRHGPRFPAVRGFDRPPVRLPVPAVAVWSADDPYCDPATAIELAGAWGATLLGLGPRGHLNAASGLGDWPEGRRLLDAFVTGLRRGRRDDDT